MMKVPEIYAIQIEIGHRGSGNWQFGPNFQGLDTSTGLVGTYFTGSHQLAQDTIDSLVNDWGADRTRFRIVRYNLAE